jgi:hypothetical protein
MTTALIILASIALHILGAVILIKHRRNVAHHRFTMPTIGRDPALTDALHARLSATQPQSDWLSPHAMRTKINAWLRQSADSKPIQS